MSDRYTLAVEKRDRAGKGVARQLRREGRLPAVVYGNNQEPVTISLPSKETEIAYQKGSMLNMICEMKIDGKKVMTIARDVQTHPVSDFVQHVDFLRVSAKTKIAVNVPVVFLNEEECPGLKEGGVLNTVRYDVELLSSATNIPENVEIDLSTSEIGDALKSTDIKLPEGASFVIEDREFTIATIAAPRKSVEEEDAEAAEAEEVAADEVEATEQSGDDEAAEGDAAEASSADSEEKSE